MLCRRIHWINVISWRRRRRRRRRKKHSTLTRWIEMQWEHGNESDWMSQRNGMRQTDRQRMNGEVPSHTIESSICECVCVEIITLVLRTLQLEELSWVELIWKCLKCMPFIECVSESSRADVCFYCTHLVSRCLCAYACVDWKTVSDCRRSYQRTFVLTFMHCYKKKIIKLCVALLCSQPFHFSISVFFLTRFRSFLANVLGSCVCVRC